MTRPKRAGYWLAWRCTACGASGRVESTPNVRLPDSINYCAAAHAKSSPECVVTRMSKTDLVMMAGDDGGLVTVFNECMSKEKK